MVEIATIYTTAYSNPSKGYRPPFRPTTTYYLSGPFFFVNK